MKKKIKKEIIPTKKYLQFLNFKDPLRFYFLTSYRKTNLFIIFYYRNLRLNQTFIIKKASFGYRYRYTSKVKIFQRNKFKRIFGLMRPKILYMNRVALLFIVKHPEITQHPFIVKWHIYKIDYNFFLICYKCSILYHMRQFDVEYFREKIGYRSRKDGTLEKVKIKTRNVFIRFYLKKSHNGCRPSKRRFIKKSRYKKVTQIENQIRNKNKNVMDLVPTTINKLNEKLERLSDQNRKDKNRKK